MTSHQRAGRKLVDNDAKGVLHIDYPATIELSEGRPAEAEPGRTVPTLLGSC
jgi:hypothetical protein